MRFFVPYHQLAAVGAGVLFGLLFYPLVNADSAHIFKLVYHLFVVADAVDDMLAAKIIKPLAGEIGALPAIGHLLLLCAASKSVNANHTFTAQLVRKAAVALLGIAWAGSAKQPADAGGNSVGSSLHIGSLLLDISQLDLVFPQIQRTEGLFRVGFCSVIVRREHKSKLEVGYKQTPAAQCHRGLVFY